MRASRIINEQNLSSSDFSI